MGNQASQAEHDDGEEHGDQWAAATVAPPRGDDESRSGNSNSNSNSAASAMAPVSAEETAKTVSGSNGAMAMLSQVWLALSPRSSSAAKATTIAATTANATSAAASSSSSRRVEQFYDVSTQNLGRGHYAIVCRGRCRRTGREVAIKKIKRFLTDEKRLRAEIAVLQRVQKHPNIVELIDVFETPREVHLVLELCTGGELFERLADKGPYSEADCVRHLSDMARAVQYLHEQGIVHRDLKPENILLSTRNDEDAVTKVADFGLAKIFTGPSASLKTKCGTWGYSAPEMISGSGVAFGYDLKVDSWGMGTILYILLCGFHPFDPHGTNSDSEMIERIRSCQYDFEDDAWATISENARDLVRHLLVLDPEDRYTMAQVLAHPWMAVASQVPLSPTIHRDLARFQAQKKQMKARSFDEEVEDSY